jgi:hypothetical protein
VDAAKTAVKPPLKERDPILVVDKERFNRPWENELGSIRFVRRAFVTRTSLDTVHFVVGSMEKWLYLAHEGVMWIRHHQRKDALLAAATLLGDEAH